MKPSYYMDNGQKNTPVPSSFPSTPPPPVQSSKPVAPTGPQFKSEPGWGGQLKERFTKHPLRIIIPIVAIVIFVIGLVQFIQDNDNDTTANVTPTESVAPIDGLSADGTSIVTTAQLREGITHLARRALEQYLQANTEVQLDAVEKLYVETVLTDARRGTTLNVGDQMVFSVQEVTDAVEASQSLLPSQRAKLEAYLR